MHVQCSVNNTGHRYSRHQPSHRILSQGLFPARHSQGCHRRFSFYHYQIKQTLLLSEVNGPSKISKFHCVVYEDNVLGFQVSMDDSVAVEVLESEDGLPDVIGHLSLVEEPLFPE